MHLFPEPRVDNGLVFSGIGLAFVDGFTAVDAIVQQAIEVALVDIAERAEFTGESEPVAALFDELLGSIVEESSPSAIGES